MKEKRDSKGRFVENSKGRPKGTSNKLTSEIRGLLLDLSHDLYDKAYKELNALEGKDFLEYYIKLNGLILPKASNINLEVIPKLPTHNLSKLSDAELNQLELLVEKTENLEEHED